MNAHVINRPCWSTSTDADAAVSASTEVTLLGEHLERCQSTRDRCFGLRCAIDAVHAFVVPRFFTTLVAAGTALALASLIVT
jgi:hypothetical protein